MNVLFINYILNWLYSIHWLYSIVYSPIWTNVSEYGYPNQNPYPFGARVRILQTGTARTRVEILSNGSGSGWGDSYPWRTLGKRALNKHVTKLELNTRIALGYKFQQILASSEGSSMEGSEAKVSRRRKKWKEKNLKAPVRVNIHWFYWVTAK